VVSPLITVDIALVRLQSDSMAPVAERKNYKNVFDVSDEYLSCVQ
jgi:hypothetical protein